MGLSWGPAPHNGRQRARAGGEGRLPFRVGDKTSLHCGKISGALCAKSAGVAKLIVNLTSPTDRPGHPRASPVPTRCAPTDRPTRSLAVGEMQGRSWPTDRPGSRWSAVSPLRVGGGGDRPTAKLGSFFGDLCLRACKTRTTRAEPSRADATPATRRSRRTRAAAAGEGARGRRSLPVQRRQREELTNERCMQRLISEPAVDHGRELRTQLLRRHPARE
jgi:hypothetical protein